MVSFMNWSLVIKKLKFIGQINNSTFDAYLTPFVAMAYSN